jgi:hypothetical protein
LIQDKAYLKSVLAEGAGAAQKRAYKILSKGLPKSWVSREGKIIVRLGCIFFAWFFIEI